MGDVGAAEGETFGQWVRRHREARNLSQERLEVLAGWAEGSGMITQIEGGTRGKRLSRDKAAGLAQALGVPVAEVLSAAGRLTPAVAKEIAERPSFEAFVNADPNLRIDQKRLLIALYRTYSPRSSSSGSSSGG